MGVNGEVSDILVDLEQVRQRIGKLVLNSSIGGIPETQTGDLDRIWKIYTEEQYQFYKLRCMLFESQIILRNLSSKIVINPK